MKEARDDIVAALDGNPQSDPEWIYAQPLPPLEDLDPAKAITPGLRLLMIDMRRAAGLPDFPEPEARRNVAD